MRVSLDPMQPSPCIHSLALLSFHPPLSCRWETCTASSFITCLSVSVCVWFPFPPDVGQLASFWWGERTGTIGKYCNGHHHGHAYLRGQSQNGNIEDKFNVVSFVNSSLVYFLDVTRTYTFRKPLMQRREATQGKQRYTCMQFSSFCQIKGQLVGSGLSLGEG